MTISTLFDQGATPMVLSRRVLFGAGGGLPLTVRHPDRTTKQHVLNTRNAYPCSVDVGNAGRGTEAAAAALVRPTCHPSAPRRRR